MKALSLKALFANFFNMSVGAAWRLHRVERGYEPFTVSSRNSSFGKAPDKMIRLGPSRMPVDGTRFGGVFHACESDAKQGRCKQSKRHLIHEQTM